MLRGDGHGDGEDTSAANLDGTTVRAFSEEVVDRERDADAPQRDDRQERVGDG